MPDSNDKKFVLELVPCSRCGNPFMKPKGKSDLEELVCDNCIKLEQRKKQLTNSVKDVQKDIETSIKDFKNQLRLAKSQKTKEMYFDKIKERSKLLSRSVELLKKIDETKDEKYIEEYKKLYERLKQEYS